MVGKPHNVTLPSGIDDFVVVEGHGVMMLEVDLVVLFLAFLKLPLVQDLPIYSDMNCPLQTTAQVKRYPFETRTFT